MAIDGTAQAKNTLSHRVDIRALANLAKLEVSDAEVAKLETELPAILSFVETIQQVSSDVKDESPAHRNIMREDGEPHETGAYTADLITAAPAHRDNQVVVKQVITRKK